MGNHKPSRWTVQEEIQQRMPDNVKVDVRVIGQRVYDRQRGQFIGIGWRMQYRLITQAFERGIVIDIKEDFIDTVYLQ